MVEKQTNRGLWIGLLSLQLVLLLIVAFLTFNHFQPAYFGFTIPTPSCPEGINDQLMDPYLANKCRQERFNMLLPRRVIVAARLAILGELLTTLGSSTPFLITVINNKSSRAMGCFEWFVISMILLSPVCFHSLFVIPIDLTRFLVTGNLP